MKIKLVLLIIIVVSIISNVYIYRRAVQAFDRYNDVRLDPLDIGDSATLSFPGQPYDFVLLGDSHASNWAIPSAAVLNLGIGGETSSQIALRSALYAKRISGGCLIVIAGGNDMNCLLTNKDRQETIIRQCVARIRTIVEHHRGNFTHIVVMTVPPLFSIPKEYWGLYDSSIDRSLNELNAGIRLLCAQDTSIKLLDAYEIVSKKRATENLTTDGEHLNAVAYRYLFDALRRMLM